MTTTVNVDLGKSIEVDVAGKTITLNGSIITSLRYINADTYLYLDGLNGNVKFKYNSTTERIEFYIDDELVGSLAKNTEENPFR